MRKYMQEVVTSPYKIMAIDDNLGILDSLSVVLKRNGYCLVSFSNPLDALEELKKTHYDLLLLDFIMSPLHGDQVVAEIRKFDKDLYILLLTGHKDLAPPLDTIKQLDIQGYCEKSDNFDQLLLLIQSGLKAIDQRKTISDMNIELESANKKLKKAYLDIIQTIRATVEAKDSYTRGHSDRVSEFSVLLGKHLGVSDEQLEVLRIGGLFHDVGKIGIPDTILLKNGKLTDEEYNEIKKHPKIGVDIIGDSEMFKDIIPFVKYHHERYDGKGYPEGLIGENIPYIARIAAVADSFDAMTSRRVYRDSLSIDIVKDEFMKNLGSQFDPHIGSIFLDIIDNHYNEIKEIQEKYN